MKGKKPIAILIVIILILAAFITDQTTQYGTAEQVRYTSSGTQLLQRFKSIFSADTE